MNTAAKNRSRIIHAGEIIIAGLLAYLFRQYVDQYLEPLGLGQFTFLIRWLLLILFIGAAIRIHLWLTPILKQKNILPPDDPW